MIEMVVSLLIIGIVMAALTMFFTTTVAATTRQSSSQAAAQLGDDAIERARALQGSAVISGRDKTSSDAQWSAPVAGVSAYLSDMVEAYDTQAATNAGLSASLPTSYLTATINNRAFRQNFYIGTCWQPSAGGTCGVVNVAGYVALYRVVVAITWSDKSCAASACSYVTSTLISGVGSEPVFLANGTAQPPAVTNPGPQTSDVTFADTLQMVATGGAPPLVWSAGTTLPTGLSIDPNSGAITGTPTKTGLYSVVVSATDGFNLVGSAAFSWTVNSAPSIALTAASSLACGSTGLSLSTSGGTGPFTFSSSSLPAGVSMDSSGNFTGSPTAQGSYPVTVSAVDAGGGTASASANWVVSWAALAMTNPSPWNSLTNVALTPLQMAATGGSGTCTWSATGLPAGLSIASATGVISGTPTRAGSNAVVVTATDPIAKINTSVSFSWTIGGTLALTTPAAQTSDVGRADTLTMVTSGGASPFSWSATGLPAGLSISASTGVISGTPTTVGAKTVVVTVTDSSGTTKQATFTWTIYAALAITNPSGAKSTAHNTTISAITATTSGGSGGVTWSAGGTLPTGLSISTGGVISGKTSATVATYTVTLTATDSAGGVATYSFTWKVT